MINIEQQTSNILQTSNLHKHYRLGGQDLHILRGIDLAVAPQEFLAIIGRSGSGKSTLLHLLGGLDRPDDGRVMFRDQDLHRLRGRARDRYRNRHVGLVFQSYHLLPELTALENVLVGAMIKRSIFGWFGGRRAERERAMHLLEMVGLKDRMRHRPSRLSGGERQRVAIARALINEPDVLLADEPTGNLDADTGRQVIELFQDLHEQGQTMVLVTHDLNVAAAADRRLMLVRGHLQDNAPATGLASSEEKVAHENPADYSGDPASPRGRDHH